MIFSETYQLVLDGKKTSTRRIRKEWEVFGDDCVLAFGRRRKWIIGHTYSIQKGRGEEAIGRILLKDVRLERIQDITEEDAKLEGFSTVEEFREVWSRINGSASWDKNKQVWVLSFELSRGW